MIIKYKIKAAIQKLVEKAVSDNVISQSQFLEFLELLDILVNQDNIKAIISTFGSMHAEELTLEQKYFQIMNLFEPILEDPDMVNYLREIFSI